MFLNKNFIMPDHDGQVPGLIGKLAPYIMEGEIQHRSHIVNGLKSTIDGLNLLFTGATKGQLIVKL
jgi:NADPH-dependent curcumin reductase CurA